MPSLIKKPSPAEKVDATKLQTDEEGKVKYKPVCLRVIIFSSSTNLAVGPPFSSRNGNPFVLRTFPLTGESPLEKAKRNIEVYVLY